MLKVLFLIVVAHISGVALNPVYKIRYPKVWEAIGKILKFIGKKFSSRCWK